MVLDSPEEGVIGRERVGGWNELLLVLVTMTCSKTFIFLVGVENREPGCRQTRTRARFTLPNERSENNTIAFGAKNPQ